jgi:hypothetical protein
LPEFLTLPAGGNHYERASGYVAGNQRGADGNIRAVYSAQNNVVYCWPGKAEPTIMDFWLEIQEAFVLMISPVFWPGLAVGAGLLIFYSVVEIVTAEVK